MRYDVAMLELTRTVRFCIAGDGTLSSGSGRHNTFAAWPAMRGLGRYYEAHVTCRGEADAVTGYFINIKRIDEAVREAVLPALATYDAMGPLGELMRRMMRSLREPLGGAAMRLTLQLTPTYSLSIEEDDMASVSMTQQYEFAAAHRLHVPAMTEPENLRVFGKCNNPAGHGHNYRLEVTVRCPIDQAAGGTIMPVEALDELVDRMVVQRFDHKNLNMDTVEFASRNPSVENIAQVICGLLEGPVKATGCELEQVRVWETGKTVCTYRPR